ncbi:MAG: DMT family transporter [Betaproteobacteria bacterium]|nr:DMT family transporter [Betaproteobacteria bacterium]
MSGLPVAVRAALWMGGALLSFCVMAVAVRELLRTMGSFEILFLRSLVSLVLVLAILPCFGLWPLRTRRLGLYAVCSVLHFGGQYAWVYAIALLPLATVFAIEFTVPVWTAVLAMPILGERLNRGRVVMLALGFAGILVILGPGFEAVPPAALVMLAGSLAYACTTIATKRLAESDSPLAVLFYMSAWCSTASRSSSRSCWGLP